MEIEWAPAAQPAAARVWSEVLAPVAIQLRASAAELAARVAEAIRAEVPELFADPDSLAENRASTEASLRLLAELMERCADPRRVELPPATIAFGRTEVQRRVPFVSVTRFYRLGHEAVWEWILARIAEQSADKRQVIQAIELGSRWLFAFADASVTEAERIYDAEEQAWLRTTMAARTEAIADIIAGRETDARRAERRLRHSLTGHHLAVAAWIDARDNAGDSQEVLDAVLAKAAARLGAEVTLTHALGLHASLAWSSRATRFDPLAADQVAASAGSAAGVRLALGEPGTGLSGFRRTYTEAVHARRVATLMHAPPDSVTRYADVAVVAMMSLDLDQAAVFVHRVLGDLARDDASARRPAETLAVYLGENGSRARTGERLGLHGNTIRYRIMQAEQLLGRSAWDRTLDLQVALALLPMVRDRLGT
jgi:DNA-binding PucR family transcriptional regulator